MTNQKTFNDAFYEHILKAADDNKNIDSLHITTKGGFTLRSTGSKRLSNISLEDCFIEMSGGVEVVFLNKILRKADDVLVPFDSVDFIEINTIKE